MPTYLDIILYEDHFKNEKNNVKKNNIKKENNDEKNKKIILDSFVNYPRLELIKRYKIQTYQFLMNKNYKNIFLKFLIIPLSFEICYNILLKKV